MDYQWNSKRHLPFDVYYGESQNTIIHINGLSLFNDFWQVGIVDIHDLVIASVLVFWIGGYEQFVASLNRNLYRGRNLSEKKFDILRKR